MLVLVRYIFWRYFLQMLAFQSVTKDKARHRQCAEFPTPALTLGVVQWWGTLRVRLPTASAMRALRILHSVTLPRKTGSPWAPGCCRHAPKLKSHVQAHGESPGTADRSGNGAKVGRVIRAGCLARDGCLRGAVPLSLLQLQRQSR